MYAYNDTTWSVVVRSIAQILLCGLDVCIVVTMYQVTNSLRLVLGTISIEEAKQKQRTVFLLASLYLILFSGCVVAIYST